LHLNRRVVYDLSATFTAFKSWIAWEHSLRFKYRVTAGESEVSAVVCSAMLASDDVLDVIGEERLRVLWRRAVFAAITGSFADSLPEPLVHQAA